MAHYGVFADNEQMQLMFDTLHQRIGTEYLREARMPDYTVDVVARHHEPFVPFAHDTVLLHLVRCADGICEQLGISPFTLGELGPTAEQSADALGLDEERLGYFALQFETVAEQMGDSLARR